MRGELCVAADDDGGSWSAIGRLSLVNGSAVVSLIGDERRHISEGLVVVGREEGE